MILRNCAFVVTQNKQRNILCGVDILLKNNNIEKIAKNISVSQNICELDCTGKIVMPGLVNCHTHLPMGLLRGIAEDKELHEWLLQVVSAEKKLTLAQMQEGALLGCIESLQCGTTSVADMYAPIEATIIGAQKSKIRTFAFSAFPTLAMRQKHIDTIGKISLPTTKDNTITIALGPHAIYSCDRSSLEKVSAYAKKNKLLKMIHIAETRKEQYECKKKYGLLPVQYLESIGFLDERTILVHAVWLTKEEIRIIAKHKCSVVHCPTSNMKLASGGVMPLQEMMAEGINVTLGTDSVVSNDNLDMFEEMKIAALLHKHHYWDPRVANAQTVLDMATINGAKALQQNFGRIEEKRTADIITLQVPTYIPSLKSENLAQYLVYSASGRDVCEVIVDGNLVVNNKEFVAY